MLVEAQYKEVKDDESFQPEVPHEIAQKLDGLRANNSQLRVEISSLEAEINQKQKLATNLEGESTSLQKMIKEARELGKISDQEQILKAKDDEIEELKQ